MRRARPETTWVPEPVGQGRRPTPLPAPQALSYVEAAFYGVPGEEQDEVDRRDEAVVWADARRRAYELAEGASPRDFRRVEDDLAALVRETLQRVVEARTGRGIWTRPLSVMPWATWVAREAETAAT